MSSYYCAFASRRDIYRYRRSPDETFIVTGCSMGGFHAGNFFSRRPDLFDTLLALSGLYYANHGVGSSMLQTK